jgi:hypothetical protein
MKPYFKVVNIGTGEILADNLTRYDAYRIVRWQIDVKGKDCYRVELSSVVTK